MLIQEQLNKQYFTELLKEKIKQKKTTLFLTNQKKRYQNLQKEQQKFVINING